MQGISDSPAWVVAKANMYARNMGKTPFVIFQGPWNVLQRDLEREVISMAKDEGMAICPWNVLAAGRIRTDAEEEARIKSGELGTCTNHRLLCPWRAYKVSLTEGRRLMGAEWLRNEKEKNVAKVLEEVAAEVGSSSIQAGPFGSHSLLQSSRSCLKVHLQLPSRT